MKLFVDDIREPWEGWLPARTITQAIRILAGGMVTEISLDHDIQQTVYNGKEFETFASVAHYLALMPRLERPTVYIHTGNPDGGRDIANILHVPYEKHRVDYVTFNKENF